MNIYFHEHVWRSFYRVTAPGPQEVGGFREFEADLSALFKHSGETSSICANYLPSQLKSTKMWYIKSEYGIIKKIIKHISKRGKYK